MSAPTAMPTLLGHLAPRFDVFPSLVTLRERAAARYAELGLPTHRDEEYKYTGLAHLGDVAWTPGTLTALSESELNAIALAGLPGPRLVLVNGVVQPELSRGLETPGLKLMPLSAAILAGHADGRLGTLASTEEVRYSVAAHHGNLRKPAVSALAALNTACFTEGAFLHLEKDASISEPIQIVSITSGEGAVTTPRLLIVAEGGSKATVIETYATTGQGRTLSLGVAEVFVAPNATLEHIKLQEESLESTHVGLTEVKQEGDSAYLNFAVSFGGELTRNDLHVFLNGSNTHLRMDGVVCLTGDQHVDNHTRLDHAKPHCESFEIYKHLLDEKASAVFNGKIFVHQDAQKTDAKQTNQAILLSPTATMNTKPQLEIFADDVKCTHGATIGQLRDDAMFYLRSRGISRGQAQALMVYAFAAEVLEQIGNEDVRLGLERRLFAKLGQEPSEMDFDLD